MKTLFDLSFNSPSFMWDYVLFISSVLMFSMIVIAAWKWFGNKIKKKGDWFFPVLLLSFCFFSLPLESFLKLRNKLLVYDEIISERFYKYKGELKSINYTSSSTYRLLFSDGNSFRVRQVDYCYGFSELIDYKGLIFIKSVKVNDIHCAIKVERH